MYNRGILLVVSGFAGSGKGTLMTELTKRYDNYALSVSATTRAPRPGEIDGKHYFFVTKEKFEEMVDKGELLEHACYVGNYYGTPKAFVEKQLSEGKDVILEIDIQGGLQIKKLMPDALLLFVMPPNVQEIYNRLKKRGTEDEPTIQKRMARGREEAELLKQYDFLVVNDDLEECTKRLHYTVQNCKYSISRNMDFISDIQQQFDDFLKNQEE